MEYQVPQFIEVEDKIFGPLTLKQFIYLAGGGGLATGLLLYLPFVIGVVLAVPVVGLALGLAFYKVNGKPLIEVIEAGLSYYTSRRLYLWRKEQRAPEAAPKIETALSTGAGPTREKLTFNQNRLHELAASLDSTRNI